MNITNVADDYKLLCRFRSIENDSKKKIQRRAK